MSTEIYDGADSYMSKDYGSFCTWMLLLHVQSSANDEQKQDFVSGLKEQSLVVLESQH